MRFDIKQMDNIINNIKVLRDSYIVNKDIFERMGITRTLLCDLAKKRYIPRYTTIEFICKSLGINFNDFVNRKLNIRIIYYF